MSVGIVGGNYNIPHVTLVMLEKKAGIKLNLVPYGSADHVPAVLGGTIEASMGQVAVMSQHIKAGTVRGLSVFAGRRSGRLADIPIVKELGYDILDIPYEFVFAPKGIPKEAISKLTVAYTKAAKSQTFQDYADKTGIFASYAGPEELTKKLPGGRRTLQGRRPRAWLEGEVTEPAASQKVSEKSAGRTLPGGVSWAIAVPLFVLVLGLLYTIGALSYRGGHPGLPQGRPFSRLCRHSPPGGQRLSPV